MTLSSWAKQLRSWIIVDLQYSYTCMYVCVIRIILIIWHMYFYKYKIKM